MSAAKDESRSTAKLEPEYQVGQVLYFEHSEYHRRHAPLEEVAVVKVGRVWMTLSNGKRADVKTLVVDGGKYSSPGRCWLNKEERESELAARKAWQSLKARMGHAAPEGVSAESIERAAKLLGL